MAGRMDKDTVFYTFSCPFFERFLLPFFERFPDVLFWEENARKTFAQKTFKKRSERFLHPLYIYGMPRPCAAAWAILVFLNKICYNEKAYNDNSYMEMATLPHDTASHGTLMQRLFLDP